MKKLYYFLILVIGICFFSCESNAPAIDNGLYITQAELTDHLHVTLKQGGSYTTQISARIATMADQDIRLTWGVEGAVLDSYNQKHGTDYKLLPKGYYSLDETASSSVIGRGKITTSPFKINIKALDGLPEADKYALPVSICGATGMNILEASRNLIILLDREIVRKVVSIDKGELVSDLSSLPLHCSSGWTLEWLVKEDAFQLNNVTQWSIKDLSGNISIYSRFGDLTCPPDQLQVKVGAAKYNSQAKFTAGKWVHLALSYDGVNLKLYVDGKLDFVQQPGVLDETMSRIQFSNQSYTLHGQAAELRVWSVVRSLEQIANNMYTIDPATPGLEVYWKCDDGQGAIAKDYSGHGRDGAFSEAPTWVPDVHFPPDAK